MFGLAFEEEEEIRLRNVSSENRDGSMHAILFLPLVEDGQESIAGM